MVAAVTPPRRAHPPSPRYRPLRPPPQGFNANRVTSGLVKLRKARTGGSQMRMDSFFKSVASTAPPPAAGVKRKADEDKKGAKGGKGGPSKFAKKK